MEKIRKLISLTFKGVTVSDTIFEDQRFTKFIEGGQNLLGLHSDG